MLRHAITTTSADSCGVNFATFVKTQASRIGLLPSTRQVAGGKETIVERALPAAQERQAFSTRTNSIVQPVHRMDDMASASRDAHFTQDHALLAPRKMTCGPVTPCIFPMVSGDTIRRAFDNSKWFNTSVGDVLDMAVQDLRSGVHPWIENRPSCQSLYPSISQACLLDAIKLHANIAPRVLLLVFESTVDFEQGIDLPERTFAGVLFDSTELESKSRHMIRARELFENRLTWFSIFPRFKCLNMLPPRCGRYEPTPKAHGSAREHIAYFAFGVPCLNPENRPTLPDPMRSRVG
ncbi:hypothetical protein EVG20_g1269 [Dentipellis fragilis]|uniref:Uncharacterized protein n=1 Tax=Dentipellis fragilis TaxID=205917 RepID=A0A4Y9ZAC9_9AGAM|nr:hypothetical protein EVG20_g1269 [Dentipellis fragilis]